MTQEELESVTKEAAERLAHQVALDLACLMQLAVAKIAKAVIEADLNKINGYRTQNQSEAQPEVANGIEKVSDR